MSNKNQKPEDNKENPGLDAKANQDQKQPKGKFYSAVSGKTAGYVYSTVGAIAVVASIYFLVTAFSWIAIVGLILSLAVLVIGVKVAGVKMPNLVNKEPQVAVS